jgi:hypothetical protein
MIDLREISKQRDAKTIPNHRRKHACVAISPGQFSRANYRTGQSRGGWGQPVRLESKVRTRFRRVEDSLERSAHRFKRQPHARKTHGGVRFRTIGAACKAPCGSSNRYGNDLYFVTLHWLTSGIEATVAMGAAVAKGLI